MWFFYVQKRIKNMAMSYHEPRGAVKGLWFLLQRDIGIAFLLPKN
jgi:hypothetical protein